MDILNYKSDESFSWLYKINLKIEGTFSGTFLGSNEEFEDERH